jgi:putative membrane protein
MMRNLVTGVLVLCAGLAFAKTNTVGGDLTVKDRQFIEQVASTNLAEIKLARLALDKSESATVRTYAQTVIDDHEKAAGQLKTIAKDEKFPEPTSMETLDQQSYDKLSTLTGKDFDTEYMKLMVKGHEKAIDTFQKASNQLSNPELKQFAAKTLPTLKEHKDMAKTDMDSMNK